MTGSELKSSCDCGYRLELKGLEKLCCNNFPMSALQHFASWYFMHVNNLAIAGLCKGERSCHIPQEVQ